MKIICTKCGSTNIICEVWMNPNTGEIHHFSDESLEYEACWDCNEYCLLTDVDDTKETLQELYKSFKGSNKREPGYLHCDVMKKDGMKGVNVYIKIGKTGIAARHMELTPFIPAKISMNCQVCAISTSTDFQL